MNPAEKLARQIADIEYPGTQKSSQRLHTEMVRKILPIITKAFLEHESNNPRGEVRKVNRY